MEENKVKETGGTQAPVETIMLFIFCNIYWSVVQLQETHHGPGDGNQEEEKEERELSMSELEVMQLDPFSSESRHIKTFSVRSGLLKVFKL